MKSLLYRIFPHTSLSGQQSSETKDNFDRTELHIAVKTSIERLIALVWRIFHICFLINKGQARSLKQSENVFQKYFRNFIFIKVFNSCI